MMIIHALSPEVREQLRGNMHKVAAIMANEPRGELTIKEAVYRLGTRIFQSYLEKKAIFEGLVSLAQLARKP
jgi:hypothetical protein